MSDSEKHPVIGWERETAVPNNHQFNRYLHAKNGHLHLDGLDLAQFFLKEAPQGFTKTMPSPLKSSICR
ncbi:MAG: hypothetical protein IPJ90_18770 [Anaerolineaceae bacterium]|nr:hypothetical protein [Anaerolineaceae bacterium]